MGLRLITAPTRYPVTLEETKAHLRVETDDDDAYLDSLIEGVATYLDGVGGILGRCLVQQTLELQLERWPHWQTSHTSGLYSEPARIELPCPPYVSLTSIKYYDTNNADQTLSTDQYQVFDQGWGPAIVQPSYNVTWPSLQAQRPDCVRIRFVAGYASVVNGGLSGTIPRNIIQCMLKAIGSAYENRDQAVDMYVDQTLLAPSRLPVVA